jgi:hypothetical protein
MVQGFLSAKTKKVSRPTLLATMGTATLFDDTFVG